MSKTHSKGTPATHFVAFPIIIEGGDYTQICDVFEEHSEALDPSSRMGEHRLHMTVAALRLPDAEAVGQVAVVLASLSLPDSPLRVSLDRLGVLKRRVVYAAPGESEDAGTLQELADGVLERVEAALGGLVVGRRGGGVLLHCTMANLKYSRRKRNAKMAPADVKAVEETPLDALAVRVEELCLFQMRGAGGRHLPYVQNFARLFGGAPSSPEQPESNLDGGVDATSSAHRRG